MYKIIITGDSYKHFESAIGEYIKRLGKSCEIIKLKPIKNGSEKQIIEKETNNLIKNLRKQKGYKIVLTPFGKSLKTMDFFNLIENKKHEVNNIVFIIGGALGIDYKKLKDNINFDLNLGNMTMPHGLALLIIIEQIYRLEMIKKGTSYNK